jgi:hypothetical protein
MLESAGDCVDALSYMGDVPRHLHSASIYTRVLDQLLLNASAVGCMRTCCCA